MATLQSISEESWRQIFPNPSDENAVSLEEFIATSKTEFAYQSLLMSWKIKQQDGEWEIPSYLLTEVEKDVNNDEIDISDLKVFRAFPQEMWLQQVGSNCDCKYIKSSLNKTQLLCDDDSLADTDKTYYPIGKKIKFPKGTHSNKLNIVYANMGEGLNGLMEVDDALGGIVRTRLIEIYAGKTGTEDKTNNTNSTA